MSYPRDCPVARWAGDGRDYVIAPAFAWCGDETGAVDAGWVRAEDTPNAYGAIIDEPIKFHPRNAAARAVLAVARGGRR